MNLFSNLLFPLKVNLSLIYSNKTWLDENCDQIV